MRKPTRYRQMIVDGSGRRLVSNAGSVLLLHAARAAGLDRGLSQALTPWRPRFAVHDPGKIILGLAVSLAIGGDCLSDIAQLRGTPAVFGSVASDPTVSRLIGRLAADAPKALAAIDDARAAARAAVWAAAGEQAPDFGAGAHAPLVIDVDATLVTAHSDKQLAAPNYKHGYGFHPIGVWADHGSQGTGEPLAMLLRKGNAGANTAADHISVVTQALRQLPNLTDPSRPGRRVLVRTDAAGGTHEFLNWLHRRRLQYSVGFGLSEHVAKIVDELPDAAWTPAYDADGRPREGARLAELTGMLDLSTWPPGIRVIVRAERPHPGAQLRFTDSDGYRLTAFATNTVRGQLATLELRHRHRARCEDRIRNSKVPRKREVPPTGLQNLPLHDSSQNQIWLALVQLACELTAWLQKLALPDHRRPSLGTQTTATAAVLDRRTNPTPSQTHPTTPGRQRRPHPPRRRHDRRPGRPQTRLTSQPRPPHPRQHHHRQWNRRPPRTHRGGPSTPAARKEAEDDHEGRSEGSLGRRKKHRG